MNKEELTARQNAIHKGMPKYWDCKLVEKIWEDVVSQDANMINRLRLEGFKTLLDALIVKTIQVRTEEAENQLELLEDMKQFTDEMQKIITINKVQADLITMNTIYSQSKVMKLEKELKKLKNIDNFGK